MTRLLPAFVGIVATLFLVSCGGGSDSMPTPGSPTVTPEPVPCTSSYLYGDLVATEEIDDSPLYSIGMTNIQANCTLSGPPALNWYDESGTRLDVPDAGTTTCQPQAGDYSTCVFGGEVLLLSGAPTPAAGVDGQSIAVIGVEQDPSCADSQTAASVGLQFPGVDPDLKIALDEPVTIPTCTESVTLYGYGPLPTPPE